MAGRHAATKYVASNTLTSHEWQPSVFLGGDIAEKVSKLKQQQGPDLHVYGSGNLVQTLLKHDLVDAFWLKIFPLTLGSGKRLFADGTIPAAFKVTESKVSPNGVILVNYERAGAITPTRCQEAGIPEVAGSVQTHTCFDRASRANEGEWAVGEQQFEEACLCRFSTSLFRAVRCWSSVRYSFC